MTVQIVKRPWMRSAVRTRHHLKSIQRCVEVCYACALVPNAMMLHRPAIAGIQVHWPGLPCMLRQCQVRLCKRCHLLHGSLTADVTCQTACMCGPQGGEVQPHMLVAYTVTALWLGK